MKQIWKTKRAVLASLALGSFVALGSPSSAEGIEMFVKNSSFVASGGMTDAEFDVVIQNTSKRTIRDLSITFDNGTSVYVGKIKPSKKKKARAVVMTLDTVSMPTANFPVNVTLNYIQAAAVVEETSQITVLLQQ